MSYFKRIPPACPVDDAPHTTCTSSDSAGGIVAGRVVPSTSVTIPVPASCAPPLKADIVQATLPPGQVTTGTYRGKKGSRRLLGG